MAYREVACSSIAQIPALVASFAAAQGWIVSDPGLSEPARDFRRPIELDPNGDAPDSDIRTANTIRVVGSVRDDGPTGLANSNAGLTNLHELRVTASDDGHEFLKARSPSPWWYGGDQRQPLIPLPTKLHLFGAGLPEPFIHCVVEYRFNVYRHLYIGSLDRTGKQGICDVLATTQGINNRWSLNYSYGYGAWAGLFSGWNWSSSTGELSRRNGGIILPDGYKNFDLFSSASSPRVSDTNAARSNVAFGGAKDGMNDTLISHGFSPFSGENFLSPVNLFTVGGALGTERRVIPLGSVRGVRNVNMRHLEPGAVIVVGNKRWRVFPQLSKQEDSFTRAGPRSPSEGTNSNYYGYSSGDTSHYWGVALLEGDI